MTRIHPQKE